MKGKKSGAGLSAARSIRDCAYCGAPEGSIPDVHKHKLCERCRCTYYCSRACQRNHWKHGGHKQRCVPPKDRSAAAASKSLVTPSATTDRRDGAADRCDRAECAICLEFLDEAPTQTLKCSHTFHVTCVNELRARGVQQTCPICRADLPPSPEKMFADGSSIFIRIQHVVQGGGNPTNRAHRGKLDEVVRLWSGAAEQGHAGAQVNLGNLYLDGLVGDQKFEKGKELHEKAAAQGHAGAQHNLGFMYHQGDGVTRNYKKAIEWYEKSAAQGFEASQARLGDMYAQGEGAKQSYEKARAWWEKAAEQGHARAQHNLGFMYQNGDGVAQNYEKAIEWYNKAAAQGCADARNNLGVVYFDMGLACERGGHGVKQNYNKALELYTKAAETGYAVAQGFLGAKYFLQQNYEKSTEWYEKAAAQGDAIAIKHLGDVYFEGTSVTQNYKRAFYWLEKGAAQGDAEAQGKLALMYDRGHRPGSWRAGGR